MKIDARGQGCPKPVMMADEALSKINEGIVEVLVDNEESAMNVSGFATQNGMAAETYKAGRDWSVKIAKGYVCKAGPGTGVQGPEINEKAKTLLLIVGTDVMGKDEDLGETLMKAFFETMKVYKQLPHTIFFLNTGVYLTTINAAVVTLLREMERMGVEIFSCGTCLTKYNLESKLAVGHRGTMNIVVEGMQDFEKTVWV